MYACKDIWQNELAAKVIKPNGADYNEVKIAANAEFARLLRVRNPFITFVHDAFECRDTFYIITERCYYPLSLFFSVSNFLGLVWIMPIARCLLQAVHYLHLNGFVHQDIHFGNVFATRVKDEMNPEEKTATQFKLGDLGVAKVFNEVDAKNTRAYWLHPPEVLSPTEFGPIDYRLDVYQIGLLFLQIVLSKEIRFTHEEILSGKPREMTLKLPEPYRSALGKALRRHVTYRTPSAMQLWRDLQAPHSTP